MKVFSMCIRPLQRWAALVAAAFCTSAAAEIITIDFDELPPHSQVKTRYADLGVLFLATGGLLVGPTDGSPDDGIVSPPFALSDFYTPGFYVQFVGLAATTVSVNVTALNGDRVFLEAWNDGELVDSAVSDGWGGTEENSTPAVPEQLLMLSAPEITFLSIQSLFSRRGSLIIDNFTFNTAAVPEPAAIGLMEAALLAGLASRRLRRHDV